MRMNALGALFYTLKFEIINQLLTEPPLSVHS